MRFLYVLRKLSIKVLEPVVEFAHVSLMAPNRHRLALQDVTLLAFYFVWHESFAFFLRQIVP